MSFFKNLLMKKMLQSQMKGVPQAEQDRLLDMIQNNPKLFEDIAKDVQVLTKQGRDQMGATMEVMKKYQGELQKLANQNK